MRIFDLTHAYQPFQPPEFIPSLIKENLIKVFLPLSRAMRKGVVRRGLQLQGWTIDAWLAADEPICNLAAEVLKNLKEASCRGNIELGASAYSHPIIPLLGDDIIKRQVEEDLLVVRGHLGAPTWFWFPEAAVDRRSLSLLHELAPDLIAIIPDGSFQPKACSQSASASGGDPPRAEGKEGFSGLVRIKFEGGGFQRVIVGNTILKDIFMNAEDYKTKPGYVSEKLDWEMALQATHSGRDFRVLAKDTSIAEDVVLMRDLENAGSKYGLIEIEKGVKEVEGLVESDFVFSLPSEINWEETPFINISDISASCWEPAAKEDEPYPYWAPAHPPRDLQGIANAWGELVKAFNRAYRPDFPKESLLVLASDIPWHFLGRREWHPNPRHSTEFTKRVILPLVKGTGDGDLSKVADRLLKVISAHN